MSVLSDGQFGPMYHGTRADLKAGDTVLPPVARGTEPNRRTKMDPEGNASGRYAFAIHADNNYADNKEAEDYAWEMATNNAHGGDRARVLNVEPAKDMEPGDYNNDFTALPEYRSPTGFKVKSVTDIMPGRQGTFPQENWAKYHKESNRLDAGDDYHLRKTSDAANHPQDEADIERFRYGSGGRKFWGNHPDDPAVVRSNARGESYGENRQQYFPTEEAKNAHLEMRNENARDRTRPGLFPVTEELQAGRGVRMSDTDYSGQLLPEVAERLDLIRDRRSPEEKKVVHQIGKWNVSVN